MSIRVEIDVLAARVAVLGAGYLLTTSPGRPHVMHLRFAVDGPVLRADGLGRSAAANIAARSAVTLLWPPDDEGYSLIVDGEATMEGDRAVTITAQGAVLHRPA